MTERTIPDSPTGVFKVRFNRVIEFRRSKFLPAHEHEMTGETLDAIIEQEGGDDGIEYIAGA